VNHTSIRTWLDKPIAAGRRCALLLAFSAGIVSAAVAAEPADNVAKRGAYLARLGDCVACHSAGVGHAPFAGGLPIDTGHGIVYSSNITPDAQHGIGRYTEQQFDRAVRLGIRADGTHLYPAMPYPSYAKMSDGDVKALYAYFMHDVEPSAEPSPSARMSFPFNQRWGMAFWNFFFVSDRPFAPQPAWDPVVARGAYLVEGLGHCGSCHTPRGFAMNEKADTSGEPEFLAGGSLGGWATPQLRGMPRWSAQDIVDYLQTGRSSRASVAGEMTKVVAHSTSHMTDDDLNAIARYLKSLPVPMVAPSEVMTQGVGPTVRKLGSATGLTLGERLYLDNCSACHFVNGQGARLVFPPLDGASVVNADDPRALIHIILDGARTPSTAKAPSVLVMPGFKQRLDDSEVAQLATFVRQAWSNHAAAVSTLTASAVRASPTAAK
jgi:mono/diheme cytochrome c family protein